MPIVLHSTARATAPYRVRIALNLKGLAYDYAPVDLVGGQQHKAEYRAVNAQRLTPALQFDDGTILTQSLAILEWLEETHPEPPLLPRDPAERATVRAMADIIACDIHPLNNLRVMRALSAMGVSPPARQTWTERWISDGFAALEPKVAALGRGWAFGDTPTFADCCLIPQVYSAERNSVSLDAFPAIRAVAARAAEHPAFAAAHPDRQPDAPAPMIDDLITRNRAWAERKTQVDPDFFARLVRQQKPAYFWIGCSGFRVPANEIVGLDPGEMFVHRNVANLAPPQDANYLSVLQYAVQILQVSHILVVGHYGCGGVAASLEGVGQGLIDHWLSPIRDVAEVNRAELAACPDITSRNNRLCELNVLRQVKNVAFDPFVLEAWQAGRDLTVHGWVYSIENGLVTDLKASVASAAEAAERFIV